MSTPEPPVRVELDVFPADDGWGFRFKVWIGDVDVLHAKPTQHAEVTGLRTHRAALLAVHARVGRILNAAARSG